MRSIALSIVSVVAAASVSAAGADPLTADKAVSLALQHNSQVIGAEASVLTARGGMWSAYSGVLPHLSADASRSGSFTREASGTQAFGKIVFPSQSFDNESYNGSYGLGGSWSLLDLSAWTSLSSARQGMRAAQFGQRATRADVVLATRQQFYEVVKAVHLAGVSTNALKLARDDERRVRALFEVGSVSKSDLLKAQVATSQSELDSLLSDHGVIAQRILLARQIGVSEGQLGEVDTTLTATHESYDAQQVFAEAKAQRPDLRSAEASVRSAELGLRSAHWSRLPSLSATGSYTPKSVRSSKFYDLAIRDTATVSSSEADKSVSATLQVNMNIFDGFLTDSRVASARARLLDARETRDALVRNLESEVRQALLGHQEAIEREALARRTLESASENLNLVQQKYNVGSATILDLIDSQVQLQRAQSDLVTALAAIRVAEATLDRVRGKGE